MKIARTILADFTGFTETLLNPQEGCDSNPAEESQGWTLGPKP